jgi:hypothetical protein
MGNTMPGEKYDFRTRSYAEDREDIHQPRVSPGQLYVDKEFSLRDAITDNTSNKLTWKRPTVSVWA